MRDTARRHGCLEQLRPLARRSYGDGRARSIAARPTHGCLRREPSVPSGFAQQHRSPPYSHSSRQERQHHSGDLSGARLAHQASARSGRQLTARFTHQRQFRVGSGAAAGLLLSDKGGHQIRAVDVARTRVKGTRRSADPDDRRSFIPFNFGRRVASHQGSRSRAPSAPPSRTRSIPAGSLTCGKCAGRSLALTTDSRPERGTADVDTAR